MAVSLRYGVRSERGIGRANNEDAAFAGPRLLAVADGMGGHAAGEVASALVIAELAPLDARAPGHDLLADLRRATLGANTAVANYAAEHPATRGMGTTLTALLFAGDRLGLVHVGDSRAYLLRDRALMQITKDDTFVQSLVDEGRLTPEQARTHPRRSMVLRAITGDELELSLELRRAKPGDRYLICSDGLSDFVTDDVIADRLTVAHPQRCIDELIRAALLAGSRDNITCVVADVVGRPTGYDIPLVTGAAGRGGVLVRP